MRATAPAAYGFQGLTPQEYICKIWIPEPDRFILDPIHQMPGLNTQGQYADRPALDLWSFIERAPSALCYFSIDRRMEHPT